MVFPRGKLLRVSGFSERERDGWMFGEFSNQPFQVLRDCI